MEKSEQNVSEVDTNKLSQNQETFNRIEFFAILCNDDHQNIIKSLIFFFMIRGIITRKR